VIERAWSGRAVEVGGAAVALATLLVVEVCGAALDFGRCFQSFGIEQGLVFRIGAGPTATVSARSRAPSMSIEVSAAAHALRAVNVVCLVSGCGGATASPPFNGKKTSHPSHLPSD
jgi:hypothetical protein